MQMIEAVPLGVLEKAFLHEVWESIPRCRPSSHLKPRSANWQG